MEKDYWIKRFEYLEKMQMVNESKYMEELTKQYVVALEKIKKKYSNGLLDSQLIIKYHFKRQKDG